MVMRTSWLTVNQFQAIAYRSEISGIQVQFDADFMVRCEAGLCTFICRQIFSRDEYTTRQWLVLTVIERKCQHREGLRVTCPVAQQGAEGDLVFVFWGGFEAR